MNWWLKNRIRMVQNNLRDVDAQLIDVEEHVHALKEIGANVLQINCGGITSFYPTDLEYQVRSPYLKDDFFGKMVEACHKNGIRIIARFDFSKLHESMEGRHEDWWIRRADGSLVRYNDTISTCVNSDYQQYKSSEIIEEVLKRYSVDGVFFNYFGYINFDYSGNRFGICQCDNCKRKFLEMFGVPLPEDIEGDPEMEKRYERFKKVTVQDILKRIRHTVRKYSDDIAISTYATEYVDIVRSESNTELDRPLPLWPYDSSDHVALIQDSYPDKVSSNVSINAVSFAYRYAGVDTEQNQLRLYQNMAAGAGLDFCILGGFHNYPDKENLKGLKEVFQYHQKYERFYGHFDRRTRIMILTEYNLLQLGEGYRGLFRILKEEHIPFSVIDAARLECFCDRLDEYDFIFIPNKVPISDTALRAMEKTTACIVAIGDALAERPDWMERLFDVRITEYVADTQAMYVRTQPEALFYGMKEKAWLYLPDGYHRIESSPGAREILPIVKKTLFGPPERAYGHEETQEPSGVVSKKGNIYLAFDLPYAYYKYGHKGMKKCFCQLIESVHPIKRDFVTNAPEMVEVFYSGIGGNVYMLQLVNLTGLSGNTYFSPIPVSNIEFRFQKKPVRIRKMGKDGLTEIPCSDPLLVTLEGSYQAYLLEVRD